ncbi:MAG TPA: 50S ribosomal protein L17 [Elusimicrobia bacterium]|nr:MAG: 50S ribosomal protein L17 [Elusimicrobia bacterium RIFOXYA12_FULL_49_49]OGS06148.1 MAG: 50S ribosomal protein L17 [Elusimicrobia bacterium RIFOXYA1_FULL_47_7]OGS09770.1 MAG: 50S ribosomal protein L17 [Elusimicrobia bacterium RIFOXYB1_FULL_48_9]OGS14611.1 MAG: 50S ribosomal protein L17 [Elusimicrobia bacterium RIFOXYA2_FULL_47_53]OGS25736.1 MAG: 50S ribosomal protein L17 [Elusimicrobia bacterium RIFOXYB12_FULL_50_12]OGS31702.1 MAG: 50S ribosomal protein L17 [Elusimicrobia bacterium RIFO
MIKNRGSRKLSVTSAHRRSLLRNLATSLFLHEKITTTLAKAKEVSGFSERLITVAGRKDVNAKRAVAKEISNKEVMKKLFEVLVPRYEGRKGGFTRIYKLGTRKGDRASTAIIQLLA